MRARPPTAGYSGTPLAKKLGIRASARLFLQASVDETWLGLKLVLRRSERATAVAPAAAREPGRPARS